MMRSNLQLLLAAVLGLVVGCQKKGTDPAGGSLPSATTHGPVVLPPMPAMKSLQPGIDFAEVVIQRQGVPMKVWVYLPSPLPQKIIPCVMIAPAGSRLIDGMALGDGDRQEHLPYVKAGMAVIAYEIDGPVANSENPTDAMLLDSAKVFRAARAGRDNAKTALDFALERIPQIDPTRIYCAGHSSAGTLSLLFAEDDQRIRACIAYAPATDVVARLGQMIPAFERALPGFGAFVADSSPLTHAAKLKCPLFLFQALDDKNISTSDNRTFVNQVRTNNQNATLVEVPTGGHFRPMMSQGIPKAIAWLNALPK